MLTGENVGQVEVLIGSDPRIWRVIRSRGGWYADIRVLSPSLTPLFQSTCWFDELIQLTWSDCQRGGEDLPGLKAFAARSGAGEKSDRHLWNDGLPARGCRVDIFADIYWCACRG